MKRYLFGLDAEYAHRLTLRMLSMIPPFTPPRARPELAVKLWGTDFKNPIGLAAGMDKDAVAIRAWEMLGFGFAELGTVTPRAQAGNDEPRLWRVPERRALINRLGFPSEGMVAVGSANRADAQGRHFDSARDSTSARTATLRRSELPPTTPP